MEAISNFPSNPVRPHINPCRNHIFSRFSIDSRSPNAFRSFRFSNVNASLNSVRKQMRPFPCCCNLSKTASLDRETFDVVVVGAGIIGLTIARQLLLLSDLSVAVVDAKMPCYGATGAGQGYIWMIHKTPGSDRWELSMRSKQLWGLLADSIQTQGMDPSQVLGWKKTGSLLLGRTPGELAMLENRVKLLSEAGLRAEYLSVTDLLSMEPALEGGNVGGAAFLPDDCQLDAHRTVEFIEKGNKYFASHGRYAEFYHNPVISLLRSAQNGEVEGVRTSKKILYSKCALVIAAGAWSGSLMQSLVKDSDIVLDVPVKPRKGHLLVLENFNQFELKHGLMEAGYADHKIVKPLPSSASGVTEEEQTLTSISMTATTDSMGNLVLGNSQPPLSRCFYL
ncbi:D-amino acid dehydrogenase-like protein [Cinnamomum micranthum f. kanehirae]|uniref:FAD-dependent oxidoreductase domain-containing protein 1 n=1 Tax=Cinnamomum micranthum f. kanehirae TaxID=337451 RepID=A0A3S3Q694_9MAGN|nr:D-amino acid dehydrogenase-like protein [Cinnamomum micranthum f. kanehirae]